MPTLDTPPGQLRRGPTEQQLYAGILTSIGSLLDRYPAAAHDPAAGFRKAHALLDGPPRHVVIGAAAEVIRTGSARSSNPVQHGAS